MNLNIQVIGTASEFVSKGQGKGYNKLTVTYKVTKPDGKSAVEAKSIMDFASPDVYKRLSEAKKDDTFSVTTEKINGYWTWTEVHRNDGVIPTESAAPAAAAPAVTAGTFKAPNTYEVKNELDKQRFAFDQAKQTLIIRQSSLSTAVEYLKAQAGGYSVEDVVTVAKQFEDYVNGNTIGQMADDIPQ